jgi:hypothetical protein
MPPLIVGIEEILGVARIIKISESKNTLAGHAGRGRIRIRNKETGANKTPPNLIEI